MVDKEDLTVRPTMYTVDVDKVPQELKDIPQWVNWEWQINGKKWSKPPVHPSGIRTDHKESNLTFDECYQNTLLNPSLGMGISLRKTDRLCGLDYDGVIDSEGNLRSEFHEELNNLPDTYVEISPSGTGVRVFGYGDIRNIGSRQGSHYEQYSTGRYLTVTGNANGQGGKPLIDLTQFTQNRGNERSDVSTVREYQGKQSSNQIYEGAHRLKMVVEHLKYFPNEDYDEWLRIGMILHYESNGHPLALADWDEWSKGAGKYTPDSCSQKWKSFGKSKEPPVTAGTFMEMLAPYRHLIISQEIESQSLSGKLLLTSKAPPRVFCIEPLFLTSSFNMIHATRGLGKTNFALSLALSLAAGKDFLKWKIKKKHKVLYMDGELAKGSIHRMMQLNASATGVTPNDIEDDSIRLINLDVLPDASVSNLSKGENQVWFDSQIAKWVPDVVIFDSLMTCFMGTTESEQAWEIIQVWMKYLRSQGLCVILIHHDNKSGLAQSGFANKEMIMDEIVHLTPSIEHDITKGMMMHFEFTKTRNLHGEEIEEFECGFKKVGLNKMEWTWTKENDNLDEMTIELYHNGDSLERIATDLGYKNKMAVSRKIKKLIEAGKTKERQRRGRS